MTLRLQYYPRKGTSKYSAWSNALRHTIIQSIITNSESHLYCPVGRVLARLETASTAKFQIIHAPQFTFFKYVEWENQPQPTWATRYITRGAIRDRLASPSDLVDGFNFQRTDPSSHRAGSETNANAIQTDGTPDNFDFENDVDIVRDGIGDTSMTSMATTIVNGSYLDGVETQKIPDHSLFLRTVAKPDMWPILIVEVKHLSLPETNSPMTINDMSFDLLDRTVLAHAGGTVTKTKTQLLNQIDCVFDQYRSDSVPFVDALIIVGPCYRRLTARRPSPGQQIDLEYWGRLNRFFNDNFSDVSTDFNEDWKDICKSHDLQNL